MGTLFRVVVYAESPFQAAEGIRAAFDRAAALDQIFSDYKPDSELNRFCRQGVDSPTPLSEDLFAILDRAQRLAYRTRGAFDVTTGRTTRLWRAARKQAVMPQPDEVRQARKASGYQHLYLDENGRYGTLTAEGIQLDLGGIAKGYAADEMIKTLAAQGLPRALVAASGDIRVGAAPPGREGWRVAADQFDERAGTFELVNRAISTSGDTEQYVEIDGTRYSHIVDPATGLGLTRRISVTVIADRAVDSDSLATAISILGPDKAHEVFPNVEAVITVIKDGKPVRTRLGAAKLAE